MLLLRPVVAAIDRLFPRPFIITTIGYYQWNGNRAQYQRNIDRERSIVTELLKTATYLLPIFLFLRFLHSRVVSVRIINVMY